MSRARRMEDREVICGFAFYLHTNDYGRSKGGLDAFLGMAIDRRWQQNPKSLKHHFRC